MNQSVIQIESLSASYGRGQRLVQALHDVSLEVRAGEIFGLLGPNGAGKTTLLSCVEGLHKPAEGRVRIDGVDVAGQPAVTKGKLGIQLQHTALLDDLTVAELVEVYAGLYQVYLSGEQVSTPLRGAEAKVGPGVVHRQRPADRAPRRAHLGSRPPSPAGDVGHHPRAAQ
jgi:ABC-2 type transport system ATP-binding protein